MGSADLMHRNLDRRVEVLLRVQEPRHLALIDDLFARAFSAETAAWHLRTDGDWELVARTPDGALLQDFQETLIVDKRRRKGSRIG
jgi:polyphosphate kinase